MSLSPRRCSPRRAPLSLSIALFGVTQNKALLVPVRMHTVSSPETLAGDTRQLLPNSPSCTAGQLDNYKLMLGPFRYQPLYLTRTKPGSLGLEGLSHWLNAGRLALSSHVHAKALYHLSPEKFSAKLLFLCLSL